MTSERDRVQLLGLARRVLTAQASGEPPPDLSPAPDLVHAAPLFVSLHAHGSLRGCIGRLESDAPLWQSVADCARAAGREDPRFPPVTEPELPEIEIEISILGVFQPVQGLEEIEVGRHGLLVERGHRRGLLLPQVAAEWKWTSKTFVEQTCRKAGLPVDAWQHGATVWRFEAEVFGEKR
jgi:AmmeMemoRadiSam system protein A